MVPAVANAEPIDVTDIFSSSTTIEGDSFNYPAGKAEMRLVRGEFEEGATFPLHTHATPLLGYIEQGELTLTKEDGILPLVNLPDDFPWPEYSIARKPIFFFIVNFLNA